MLFLVAAESFFLAVDLLSSFADFLVLAFGVVVTVYALLLSFFEGVTLFFFNAGVLIFDESNYFGLLAVFSDFFSAFFSDLFSDFFSVFSLVFFEDYLLGDFEVASFFSFFTVFD